MIKRIEDAVLAFIQRRCDHPGMMVAVDILEGCGGDVEVAYCRRCGAVRPDYTKPFAGDRPFDPIKPSWRFPDPNLWRG